MPDALAEPPLAPAISSDRASYGSSETSAAPVGWTIGAVLERRADFTQPPAAALISGYLEGQTCLQRQRDTERLT